MRECKVFGKKILPDFKLELQEKKELIGLKQNERKQEKRRVEIILSKPVGLDLEWTNGVPYICIYFLFFFQR